VNKYISLYCYRLTAANLKDPKQRCTHLLHLLSTMEAAAASSYSSSLLGKPVLLIVNERGESNWQPWKRVFFARAASLKVDQHYLKDIPCPTVAEGASVALHLPTMPVKGEKHIWEEVVNEAADVRTLRRAEWSAHILEFQQDFQQFEWQQEQFSKRGPPRLKAVWTQQRADAINLVYSSVDPEIAAQFVDGATPATLWTHLKTHYGTDTDHARSQKLALILNMAMDEATSPRVFWEKLCSLQKEVFGTVFAVNDALLRQICLKSFAGLAFYTFQYQKFRGEDINANSGALFEKFIIETTTHFQDSRDKNGGTTAGLFGKPSPPSKEDGGGKPKDASDNYSESQTVCSTCKQVGHRHHMCKVWRQRNPTLHVVTSTEPKKGHALPLFDSKTGERIPGRVAIPTVEPAGDADEEPPIEDGDEEQW